MTLHVLGSTPVWVLLVVLAVRWAVTGRPGAALLWLGFCGLLVAIGLTIDDPTIYRGIGFASGIPNFADVAGRVLLVSGLFCLSQCIRVKVAPDTLYRPFRLLSIAAVVVALVVLFVLIDAPTAQPQFMVVYGGQPAAALYSAVQMGYAAAVVGLAAVAVLRDTREDRDTVGAYWFFITGAGMMTLLAAIAIAMDVTHVLGLAHVVSILSAAYTPVFLLSLPLLAIGASRGAITSTVQEYRAWRSSKEVTTVGEKELRALEDSLRAVDPDRAGGLYFALNYRPREWRQRLRRLEVELDDRRLEMKQLQEQHHER